MTNSPLAPNIGVVVLTMGKRPAELRRGIESVLAQKEVLTEIVVIGNGWDPKKLEPPLPTGIRTVHLPENLGIPAGRNRGVPEVVGELLFFLDDDAYLPDPDFLQRAAEKFAVDKDLGLIQPRVVDPTGLVSPRRWTPRIRKGDPRRSSNVFSCWEGAVVVPRTVFELTGGWGEPYFYAHEGIELAWRVWDAGYRAWYAGELTACHPVIDPARHEYYYRLNARNRVWLSRRNLPQPIAFIYVSSWTLIQLLRWWRRPKALRAWFAGWWEGLCKAPGGRRALSWQTVWRMTRAGRPPII